jgi:cytochrome c551/c552
MRTASSTSLRLAVLAAGTLCAASALAQSTTPSASRGRILFEQKQCSQCHFFEARGIAPSA